MKKLARFFISVRKEMDKVKWPDKKELIQYSIATVFFVILFALFFTFEDVILAFIRTVIG